MLADPPGWHFAVETREQMRNPYTVLGVEKGADEKAIKSAFRKLAKKYHPDQNPDDKSAQKKFAEVNQAYEIVGDREKRTQFDRGEIDETGKPRFAGFEGGNPFGNGNPFGQGGQRAQGNPFGGNGGGFGGAEDILNEIFGSAFGGNARAARGAGQRTHYDPGAGFGGASAGQSRKTAPSLDLEMKAAVTVEDLMRGKTTVRMPDGKQVSVSIPAEAEDGQTIRLKGKGQKAPGRQPGDALVTLVMRKHQTFERQGTDLRAEIHVPLEIAVLGGKAPVETMDGKLSLTIPAGTSSGKVFRLKGKGLPKKSGGFGDLLVSASIQLPQDRLDELARFFSGENN